MTEIFADLDSIVIDNSGEQEYLSLADATKLQGALAAAIQSAWEYKFNSLESWVAALDKRVDYLERN